MSLAIECGASTSHAILFDENGSIKREQCFGSGNYQLLPGIHLELFYEQIRAQFHSETIHSIGVGMPGILDGNDKTCVETVVRKLWPEAERLWVGNDLETALACIDSNEYEVSTVVIAGTGSCCYGSNGKLTAKVGGYGHKIGDRGSGYSISERALRLALRQHEHNCPVMQEEDSCELVSSVLLASIMKHLGFRSVKQLISWSVSAKKDEMAALAPIVLLNWKQGDEIATTTVKYAINELSADCVSLVNKLRENIHSTISHAIINNTTNCSSTPNITDNESVTENRPQIIIGLTGSLFTKDALFAELFKKSLFDEFSNEINFQLKILKNTVEGAFKKLQKIKLNISSSPASFSANENTQDLNQRLNTIKITDDRGEIESESWLAENVLPLALGLSLTERRNEKSMNLDRMSTEDAIDLMISEEQNIFDKICQQKKSIGILVEKVCNAFRNGGRLFYVGAGTSGRLGILDATECPPTFSSPHEWVQGIMAGGFSSVSVAKEGAEDSIVNGMRVIDEKNVNCKDVVVGIAACGRTPFVWGSIHRAKSLQAFTAFLTFNTELKMKVEPDLLLAMDLGAEVLTGSTRLKCGTATKCVLNMLSTLAMVKYGKCFENLMVDLNPANQKLKQRSLRIVLLMTSQVKGISEQRAVEVLLRNKYDIRTTVEELRAGKDL